MGTFFTSMLVAQVGSILKTYYSRSFSSCNADRQIFTAVVSITSAITLLLWGGFPSASCFTIGLGLAFGTATALQHIFQLKALETGPWAYTTVIVSLSMLIPTVLGALFWGETITLTQGVGIALLVCCLVLSVDRKSNDQKGSLQWLGFCMITFVCSGAIGLMQKWHQNTSYNDETNSFLIIAFAVSSLISLTAFFLSHKTRTETEKAPGRQSLVLLLMVICGITLAVNNKLNLYLAGTFDSAFFFPLMNGWTLILTTICSILLFREKLSFRQWIGLTLGFFSVIFISNPFQ